MLPSIGSFATGLVLVLLIVNTASAAQAPEESANSPASTKSNSLLRIGEMAQAAADLRKAAESFERLADTLDGMVQIIAESLARMSSEFDPFGYKTAFRTLGQQTEIIQQQSELIRELQEREIERLQSENQTLRKQLEQTRRRVTRQRAAKKK